MLNNKAPKRLWNYGLIWTVEIGNLSVSSSRYASGRKPLEYITGDTPDINSYLDIMFMNVLPTAQMSALVNFQLVNGLVYLIRFVG